MRARERDEGPVVSHPGEAVLDIEHVARWLRVGVRTVEKLDIPYALLGTRTRRYLGADVIEYLRRLSREGRGSAT